MMMLMLMMLMICALVVRRSHCQPPPWPRLPSAASQPALPTAAQPPAPPLRSTPHRNPHPTATMAFNQNANRAPLLTRAKNSNAPPER